MRKVLGVVLMGIGITVFTSNLFVFSWNNIHYLNVQSAIKDLNSTQILLTTKRF